MKASALSRHEHKPLTDPRLHNGDKSDRSPNVGGSDLDVTHVLGMTVFSNSTLTSNPVSGVIAYPAGSVLILLDCVKNKQVSFIVCPGKMITALNFSPDGKFLLIGESGHRAAVRVWRMDTMHEVASLGQFAGIKCVSFTSSMREIVVVGNNQDMVISVWSWPKKSMLSLNKFSDNVCAMTVADDGSFFVTVGNRHVKFYYLDFYKTPMHWRMFPLTLSTKIVLIEDGADSCLCDIVHGGKDNQFLFAVYTSGILCQINRSRHLVAKANVELSGGKVHCLATDGRFVFVGCSNGLIQMYDCTDLQLVTTLPFPHSLGVDISQYSEIKSAGEQDDESFIKEGGLCTTYYPAVTAMLYDKVHHRLAVIYDDCSIYIWSRDDQFNFKKRYSSLFHSGCVWDFTIYPLPKQDNLSSEEIHGGALPPGSLITVSGDGTLRSWDVNSNISIDGTLKRNPVSSSCLKIVHANSWNGESSDGKDGLKHINSSGPPAVLSRSHTMKSASSKKGRNVLSVVAVCPDGLHIATGNRRGQISIYDAYSMETVTIMVAHEAEVTVISYTKSRKYKILASGSRDRMIHLMDACNNYQLMSTLDDHSSTITAIHFTCVPKYLIMVSSSLDMSVLARAYVNDRSLSFSHVRAIVEKKAVVDFTLHPWSGQIALVCQDKLVHIKSIGNAHQSYSYRGCSANGGHLIKISADPSGLYLLTACTKKTINLIEFETGEILRTYCGHAESVTRVQFSLNMKYIISSSSDGCIFFWELPVTVAYSVKLVMAEMGLLTRGMVLGKQWKTSSSQQHTSPPRRKSDHDMFMSTEGAHSSNVRLSNSCSLVLDSKDCGSQTSDYAIRTIKSDSKLHSDNWICSQCDVRNIRVETVEDIDKLFRKDSKYGVCKQNSLDTWMTTCCRRRELFKLEAKSIKRVLTMMRLVADAMEKDLKDASTGTPKQQIYNQGRDINCNKDATNNKDSTQVDQASVKVSVSFTSAFVEIEYHHDAKAEMNADSDIYNGGDCGSGAGGDYDNGACGRSDCGLACKVNIHCLEKRREVNDGIDDRYLNDNEDGKEQVKRSVKNLDNGSDENSKYDNDHYCENDKIQEKEEMVSETMHIDCNNEYEGGVDENNHYYDNDTIFNNIDSNTTNDDSNKLDKTDYDDDNEYYNKNKNDSSNVHDVNSIQNGNEKCYNDESELSNEIENVRIINDDNERGNVNKDDNVNGNSDEDNNLQQPSVDDLNTDSRSVDEKPMNKIPINSLDLL